MNPVLERILKTRLVSSLDGAKRELGGEISPEEGYLLQDAIRQTQAVSTLEVGLGYGISTLFILEAIADKPGAHHIVMDPNQSRDCAGIGLNNLEEAGYRDIVEFHEQSSHILLPQLERRGIKLDFAFIDGSHLFDYTILEFFYIDRMLRRGGIISFDDASMPAVRKVIRFILTNRCYRIVQCIPAEATSRQAARYEFIKWAGGAFPLIRRVIRQDLQEPDIDRGFIPGARYVALQKDTDDSEETRPWHYYHDF